MRKFFNYIINKWERVYSIFDHWWWKNGEDVVLFAFVVFVIYILGK